MPYQNVIAKASNLRAVMKGFQEARDVNGYMPDDAANAVANSSRRATLIAQAFDQKKRDSIYSGVSKDAAVNLYEIKKRNVRRDSIYAFQ